MTWTRTPFCTRPVGTAGLLLSLSLLAACGGSEPDRVVMGPSYAEIEISQAPSMFGPISLGEIEISPELPEAVASVEREGGKDAAPRPVAQLAPIAAANNVWANSIAESAAAPGAQLAAVSTSIPSELGAMGGFDPDFAPVRKSFASKSGGASKGAGLASVDLTSASGPGADRSGGSVAPKEMARTRKGLEADDIKRSVQQQLPRVRACYERVLKTEEHLQGRLMMAFSVQPDGSVSGVAVAEDGLGNDKVSSCVTRAVSQFRFPEGVEVVAVEYPMVFSPGHHL